MKKLFYQLILTLSLIFTASTICAQAPPPPPAEHGSGGNLPAGGGAPLTGGIGILLALGAVYGGKKVYKFWKDHRQIEE
jgi:hypothetical protein